MKHITIILAFLMTLSTPVSAEDDNLFKGKSYGSFMFFEEVPNALFFEDDISKNDSFEFRKAIRNHDIDTIVLSSPGGALFEGLTIAGMIFDKGLTTYVPKTGRCASACAFMFFAGNNRQATGRLGVHQFYSSSDDQSAKIANVEYGSQFTVSEIIGYLNEFETPPFVFEKMFAQKRMYFFSEDELEKLNTAPTDEATLANFSKIDEFVIKAKEATKQDKAEAIEAKATEAAKDDNDLELRKQIQAELNRVGCTLGRVDGKIGPASKRALSRFNKRNKSSYGVKAFFNDKSQLEQLKKINSGFCPKIVMAKKETINFRGSWACLTDGLGVSQTVSVKLEAVSDTVYKATGWAPVGSSFSFEPVVLTKNTDRRNKRKYGKFTAEVREKYGWNITVDLEKGIMSGSGWNRDSLLALSVKIITLDALECTFYLRRIDN